MSTIKFKFFNVEKDTYETYDKDDNLNVGFEYDPEDHTVAGVIITYLDPNRKLRKGTTYFREHEENSIITRCSQLNLIVLIPVLMWELEQKNIKAKISWTQNQALIIEFPNKAEQSLFLFRFHDIFGKI